MTKKALNLIVKTLVEGGQVGYEIEKGTEGKILIVDLYNKNKEATDTLRFYYDSNCNIVAILID